MKSHYRFTKFNAHELLTLLSAVVFSQLTSTLSPEIRQHPSVQRFLSVCSRPAKEKATLLVSCRAAHDAVTG